MNLHQSVACLIILLVPLDGPFRYSGAESWLELPSETSFLTVGSEEACTRYSIGSVDVLFPGPMPDGSGSMI